MTTILKKAALLFVPATFLLAGCTDFDNGFDVKEYEYSKNFTDTFGEIDPNQDWSMAGYYDAHVYGMEDGTLELLYSDPIAGTPVVIAKRTIENGEVDFKFNAVKGTKRVFARIKKENGDYTLNRYFEIYDNELIISNVGTRSGHGIDQVLSGTSRAIKGDVMELYCPQLLDHTKMSEMELYTGEAANAVDYIDGYYRDKTHNQNVAGKNDFYYNGTFTNIYPLYNVINPEDERPWWYVEEIAPFFEDVDGQEGCFKESVNHVVLMKDDATPHLEKDLVFTISNSDASKNTGVFYLDYFFKGTEFHNQFGYFYYTGDTPTYDQFMTMPKFILVDNMSGSQRKVHTVDADTEVDWFLLSQQYNLSNSPVTNGIAGLSLAQSNWDTKVIGTRLYLTYFGEEGTDATGTLDFPVGTKIGIFFIGQGENRENKIITSISKLNQELYNEVPHAASFKLNDKIVFAMEDMNYGGDKDINDAMFIAYGDFEKQDIPDIIVPVQSEGQNWVMACEDLGGSYDYDFNDLVFALRMTPLDGGEKSKLELVPLAAGGTLDAKIEYDGTIKGEIHSIVSPSGPITTPINVTSGSSPYKGYPITLAASIASDTDINDVAKKVKVIVTQGEATTNNNVDGTNVYNIGYKKDGSTAPQVLLLPGGWDWPSEQTFICDIYEGFSSWVKDGDVTTWCNTKKDGATRYVNNPLPYVAPSQEETTPGEGGGTVTPPASDGTNDWNITITGNQTMEMNSNQTITISVEGLSDYSKVECGLYSTNLLNITKVSNTQYTLTGKEGLKGTTRFYVLVPGDASHATTRKTYEITVGNAIVPFTVKIGDDVITANQVVEVTPGQEFSLTISSTVCTNHMDITSANSSIATATQASAGGAAYNNTIKAITEGETKITVIHSAHDNYDASTFSFKLKVTKAAASNLPESNLTLSLPSQYTMYVGETVTLTTSNCANAGNTFCSSSNTEVATIPTDVNGYTDKTITAVKAGTAIITVTDPATSTTRETKRTVTITVKDYKETPYDITNTVTADGTGITKYTLPSITWDENVIKRAVLVVETSNNTQVTPFRNSGLSDAFAWYVSTPASIEVYNKLGYNNNTSIVNQQYIWFNNPNVTKVVLKTYSKE